MSEIITAIVHQGAFVPDQPTAVAEGTRVRLVVESLTAKSPANIEAFDAACDEVEIDVAASRLSREELHDRN